MLLLNTVLDGAPATHTASASNSYFSLPMSKPLYCTDQSCPSTSGARSQQWPIWNGGNIRDAVKLVFQRHVFIVIPVARIAINIEVLCFNFILHCSTDKLCNEKEVKTKRQTKYKDIKIMKTTKLNSDSTIKYTF